MDSVNVFLQALISRKTFMADITLKLRWIMFRLMELQTCACFELFDARRAFVPKYVCMAIYSMSLKIRIRFKR